MESTLTAEASLTTKTNNATTVAFHGDGKTYFGIWITNLLLTIVTFGIYGAWAKVRNHQYMYGNTEIDGHTFKYHAKPVQILIGRVIAIAGFSAFAVCLNILQQPLIAFAMMGVYFLALPWIINSGLRFSMRMTSYRNVRFNFKGTYGGAFKTFLLFPFLSVFTFYLITPWVLRRMHQYMLSNSYYGEEQFETNLQTHAFSKAFLSVLLIMFTALAIPAGLALTSGASLGDNMPVMIQVAFLVTYIIGYILGFACFQTMVRNHLYNNTRIPGVATLHSNLRVRDYVRVFGSNILAIVATLGFFTPWAAIRHAKLLASATTLTLHDGIEAVQDSAQANESAIGEEAADVFDLDLAIG